jgi:chemotaxis signal transduction protein
MTQASEGLAQRLAELQRAFDAAFEVPARTREVDYEDMLAIQVQGGRFAVRINELAGVHAVRKIVPLPGAVLGLVGLVGVRGRLVAAYRLADLLGQAAAPDGRLRWFLLCRDESQVGLAIEGIDAYIRVPKAEVYPVQGDETLGEHVSDVVRQDGVARGVLNMMSILAAIERRASTIPNGRSRG